ncbi:MAG: hypothetical protein Q9210_004823, partial [Variospora velana]
VCLVRQLAGDMRFLVSDSEGTFSLTEKFFGDDVPQYAILSHTWGLNAEEVSFKDIVEGTGAYKPDGLRYFWVDTCCIDITNNVELAEVINSMYQWYANATKCYVYLRDVARSGDHDANTWEEEFRKSRWFTRGWMLQELLAPMSVEFFSVHGKKFGTKATLQRQICEITGLPIQALQGAALSTFSIAERISWQEHRETKLKEDEAYSLLGICGVYMPLIYGEGKSNAFKRLRREIDTASNVGIDHNEFSIPFSLSDVYDIEHFIAREAELLDIHASLTSNDSRRIVVLHGLGGVGKTQLAIAYAKRYRQSYSAFFWVHIKDEDSIKQSFSKMAKQILHNQPSATYLSSVGTINLDEIVDAVKKWLSLRNNKHWLMVYDNYDNPKLPNSRDLAAVDIRKYLPESYQGSVIITTRSPRVDIGHTLAIRKLDNIQDSLEILMSTSRIDDLKDDPNAVQLAETLDGLPLALATAGTYLCQAAIDIKDYVRLYHASWDQLQETSPGLSSYEDRTLYSTWQISFDRHWDRDLTKLALHCTASCTPNKDVAKWWLIQRRLLKHAARCSYFVSNDLIPENGLHLALHSIGDFYADQGKQTEAEVMYERALVRRERELGSEDMSTLKTVHKLGVVYRNKGMRAKAKQMYERALAGREKALGAEHIASLYIVSSLSILERDLGNLAESERKYERALAGLVEAERLAKWALDGREKAMGPEHTSTLDTVESLGILYRELGRLAGAEQLHLRALDGREKALGETHMITLSTVSSLGTLYQRQGRLREAEQMHKRALTGITEALGSDHPKTETARQSLQDVYHLLTAPVSPETSRQAQQSAVLTD